MRFILVERFLEVTPHRARAITRFDPDLEIFADHFPGLPLVPGVLLIEAMGQAAGWAILANLGFAKVVLLAEVQAARFRRPVRPGVMLDLEADFEIAEGSAVAQTTVRSGSRLVAEATLRFSLSGLPANPEVAGQLAAWGRATAARLGLPPLGGDATPPERSGSA